MTRLNEYILTCKLGGKNQFLKRSMHVHSFVVP